jgi:hypothetical protein
MEIGLARAKAPRPQRKILVISNEERNLSWIPSHFVGGLFEFGMMGIADAPPILLGALRVFAVHSNPDTDTKSRDVRFRDTLLGRINETA